MWVEPVAVEPWISMLFCFDARHYGSSPPQPDKEAAASSSLSLPLVPLPAVCALRPVTPT